MLLQGAAVIVRVELVHGGIGRFQFINVREEEPTMVARLPQQVLLLLVLVTGTAAEATRQTEESLFNTHDTRKAGRSFSWFSSSTDRAMGEGRSIGKFRRATSWQAETSSPRKQVALQVLELVNVSPGDEEEENEMQRSIETLRSENDTGQVKVSCQDSTVSSRSTSGGRQKIDVSTGRTFVQSTTGGLSSVEDISTSRSFSNIAARQGNRSPFKEITLQSLQGSSTAPTTYVANDVVRRQMRHVSDVCEKFSIGDEAKQEFYSPNYPDNYPNLTECVKVLKADEGMLLKLDFRDEFKLEESPECRYDFLEVRDGQHGYSNLLGNFCGTNFPPEIASKTRYLWLRFRSDDSIEGKGFKAVWSMIPRPTSPGVPPEPEPCVREVSGMEAIINSDDVMDRKKLAEKEGIALDCMWNITVKEGWKIQLTFSDPFKLQRPNECDANFVDIFRERTDMSSREKNFCGSIADTVLIGTNIAFVRFYAEPKALNSSFEAVMTALRDRDPGDKPCSDGEYYCEDATCIAAELQCNGRVNCRFRWDEEDQACNKKKSRLIDSQHIVIILIVFSMILFGMSFAFVFNCVRKLVRDHRIIREHIRQSRENRLDELGRKATPCPISASRTDIRDRDSESPSLEVVPSKELLPPTTLIPQEYTKDLALEMSYNTRDMNDIHQSNNVSNATQERLQESNEEPEMRDNSCQTRESLFEARISDSSMPLGFTTFGVRGPSSQNGTSHLHHHRHHHLHHHQSPPQSRHGSQPSQPSQHSTQQSSEHSAQQPGSQCSGCSPASRGRDGSMGVCPKHNPIPAPHGWSTHESGYPLHQGSPYTEPPDYPSYQRFQSPKPSRENSAYRESPKLLRQATVGSGERYGSSVYGSGHGSSNTQSTQHSGTPKCPQQTTPDPRYRAEAVIEVDQRRPFSIESTKSAPDVIATH